MGGVLARLPARVRPRVAARPAARGGRHRPGRQLPVLRERGGHRVAGGHAGGARGAGRRRVLPRAALRPLRPAPGGLPAEGVPARAHPAGLVRTAAVRARRGRLRDGGGAPPRTGPQRRRVDLPQHVALSALLRGERGAPRFEREPMTASRRRRLAAGALTLTAALLASACSAGGDEAADLSTLTMMVPLFQTAPDPEGEVQQAVEKLVGKKLQITWVPNAEYNEKTNVTLASDALPDVMVIQDPKGASFVQAATAGAFWDLTDKLDKYPNLKPRSEQAWINSKTDGRNYGVYRVRPLLRSAVILRRDWLDKLGLELPKTTDDLYEIAKAFT